MREYQQVQGLHIDPTVDVDGHDFKESRCHTESWSVLALDNVAFQVAKR